MSIIKNAPQAPERLDWMYEQSAAAVKPNDDEYYDEMMKIQVSAQKDKDIEAVKNLQGNTAGSLFLTSATKTTEDMVRKLREDPLFQIRRQEQAAKESMMTNPLIMAKIKKKQEKAAKKAAKKEKKAAKKEEKALKKAAKAKKKSSSDSSEAPAAPPAPPAKKREREEPPEPDLSALGPSQAVLSKRMEHEMRVKQQKDAALASRGLGRRMTDEEKDQRVQQMRVDAKKHERMKDDRIASAEDREKQIEELEAKMRGKSDQKYFRDLRKDAYAADAEMSVADRIKTQRHRRQKNINDPLEKD